MIPQTEKWGIFEISIQGKKLSRPFTEGWITGRFFHKNETRTVKGFYDGKGWYKIRFMPSYEGNYEYEITGNCMEDTKKGSFFAGPPGEKNHGPVRTAKQWHFSYEDGTPYYPVGTTCYAWLHQKEEIRRQTIESLQRSGFNKLRFCIFPKYFIYNQEEPQSYPFEGIPCDLGEERKKAYTFRYEPAKGNQWDYHTFYPPFFRNLEKGIEELLEFGIEADVILFHPYDIWGFSNMEKETDDSYIRYVAARLGAYRNVWFSLANEYDCISYKNNEDWQRLGRILKEEMPYQKLLSIHNCSRIYDQREDWISHCSIQRTNIYQGAAFVKEWRETYGKPVVYDECGYEGNLPYSWGNLSAKELVKLFWMTAVRGGYCSHGETYLDETKKLWWSHGGGLKGESWKRITFYREIMEEIPGLGLKPVSLRMFEEDAAAADSEEYENRFYLCYCTGCPVEKEFHLETDMDYVAETIDTWEMTKRTEGTFRGDFRISLPQKEGMAIRLWEKSLWEKHCLKERRTVYGTGIK